MTYISFMMEAPFEVNGNCVLTNPIPIVSSLLLFNHENDSSSYKIGKTLFC